MARDIELVVVGYRPGALHASSRLGLRTFLVDDREPSPAARRRLAGCAVVDSLDDAHRLTARMHDELGGERPRAVVGVGERTVMPAAVLREAWALGGIEVATARLARDKPAMKAAARAAGVPVTAWQELDGQTRADDLIETLGLPLILKLRDGSGTRGLVKASSRREVVRGLATIEPEERAGWMAERFVDGVEMSVESFVQDGRILFWNPTEYYRPAFANIAPAVLSEAEAERIAILNRHALGALSIQRGMTHLELFRTHDGPVFGEVAVRPPGGRIMRLLRRAYGFDPWLALLRIELGEVPALPAEALAAAGVWMLHPGAGRVRAIRGLSAARRSRGVRKLVLRLRTGRRVRPRESTGRDTGWIEVHGKDRDQVAARMQAAHDLLTIEMDPPEEQRGEPPD